MSTLGDTDDIQAVCAGPLVSAEKATPNEALSLQTLVNVLVARGSKAVLKSIAKADNDAAKRRLPVAISERTGLFLEAQATALGMSQSALASKILDAAVEATIAKCQP